MDCRENMKAVEVDGRVVGIDIVPTLPELHVELQDFELAHGKWRIGARRRVGFGYRRCGTVLK